MEILRLAISIAAITFVGYNILYLPIFKKGGLPLPEKLFISYGAGLGFLSLEMLLFYFIKAKFSLKAIFIPWAPLFIANAVPFRLLRRSQGIAAWLLAMTDRVIARTKSEAIHEASRGCRRQPQRSLRYRALKIFLIFGITFEILYALFRALIKPIESYDAIAIYAIKSKIFYLAGSIPQGFFRGLARAFPHPDYPLNIPLSQTLIYLSLGNLNDQLVKLIFPLFFIGILVMLYFSIRRFASQAYALLFTFILASVPQFNAYAANAYLDLPLAYYCFASSLALFSWLEDKKKTQSLILSAIMAGLAGWTKNEGLMYCAINILLIAIYFVSERNRTVEPRAHTLERNPATEGRPEQMRGANGVAREVIGAGAVYIGIVSIISLPWALIKRSANLVNADIASGGFIPTGILQEASHKIAPIIYEFQKQFFGPKKWNILWPIILLALVFNYKKIFSGITKYITMSLLFAVLGYIFFYLASPVEINYFLSRTWSRFIIHFLPMVIYLAAYLMKEELDI